MRPELVEGRASTGSAGIIDGTVGWLGSINEQSGESITLDPSELTGHCPVAVQHSNFQCLHTQDARLRILATVGAERAYRKPYRIIQAKTRTESATHRLRNDIGRAAHHREVRLVAY